MPWLPLPPQEKSQSEPELTPRLQQAREEAVTLALQARLPRQPQPLYHRWLGDRQSGSRLRGLPSSCPVPRCGCTGWLQSVCTC